ncbi:FimB/Mfa2 family fimbrial subunit [Segatella copri]|uniref:FimB/Mfa2 family fimbrial subunit n=1 Tax=Segatella copri TaxID=165179 RepID=UPI003D091577
MKAISKYFAMCAIALLGLANTSCMSDDIESTPSCDFKVVLDYKVGSSTTETRAALTRADEVGKAELNENQINRLDLFIFKKDGSCVKQVTFDGADVQGSPTTEYKQKELTELTRSNIDGNDLYLVANLSKWGNINSLKDLKTATINQAAFQHNQKQDAFVMDAKMLEREVAAGKIHLKFQLKRALAKIRLNVKDASGKTVDPTEYACQLMHYAADGSIIAEGTSTNNALNTDAAASSKVTAPAVIQDNKAVFYSYANSWIDKSKDPKVEEPIDVSKQTYILLKAKFNNKDYFYKVPVNKRLYESNDAATIDWTKYEPLYRLDRNTIYDVTATVDREGGSDPENPATLNVQPIVSDWDDNIAWDYTDKVSIEMVRDDGEYRDRDAVEVHYGIPNGGGPAITLNNIDTGNKNWILQCDNPDFAFYVDGNTYDTVSKSDINGDSFTFYVVPKRNKDLVVERNFDTNVFIVLAPDMRKVLFNVGDGKLPGDGFNIKFTQGDDHLGN